MRPRLLVGEGPPQRTTDREMTMNEMLVKLGQVSAETKGPIAGKKFERTQDADDCVEDTVAPITGKFDDLIECVIQ